MASAWGSEVNSILDGRWNGQVIAGVALEPVLPRNNNCCVTLGWCLPGSPVTKPRVSYPKAGIRLSMDELAGLIPCATDAYAETKLATTCREADMTGRTARGARRGFRAADRGSSCSSTPRTSFRRPRLTPSNPCPCSGRLERSSTGSASTSPRSTSRSTRTAPSSSRATSASGNVRRARPRSRPVSRLWTRGSPSGGR